MFETFPIEGANGVYGSVDVSTNDDGLFVLVKVHIGDTPGDSEFTFTTTGETALKIAGAITRAAKLAVSELDDLCGRTQPILD